MIINDLLDFIQAAERSRKYPRNTATAKRSALKLFDAELNEDEAKSLESFKKNFESIYQEVCNKNKSRMSASSLATYKRRVSGLIKDYEKYGLDPTRMSTWNRPVRKIALRRKSNSLADSSEQKAEEAEQADVLKFELPLRDDAKVTISVPKDITKEEIGKIKKYTEFLESISRSQVRGDSK